MSSANLDVLYTSRKVTGPLTEDLLLKELRSKGLDPTIRRDLLYRLWTLRANHFDMI